MNKKKLCVALAVIMILLISVSGRAQDRETPYIGVNLSLFNSIIIDNFTRHVNGMLNERNTFEDDYKGQFGGVYFGYKLIDKKRTFIHLQAHVNLYNKEFSTETPNSTLTRKLNYSFGIDLQPGFYVQSGFLCYLNFSVESGKFKFSKTGTSTTYDMEPSVFGYGFGAGIGYQVASSVCLKLQYQHNQYCTTEIASTLAGIDAIIDYAEFSPRYDIFMLSLQYNFR
ncbi:MAG: outer membrane beta-barrel protein [Candidatus Aminicenantes bacterium]|nr:outer membrane beta-barrel protein [Candidatus Aminicenantes bacterium]MDH5705159.1 outer membrane beta-barrel protein [Candidatus Aminicenantes bacterium]